MFNAETAAAISEGMINVMREAAGDEGNIGKVLAAKVKIQAAEAYTAAIEAATKADAKNEHEG